MKKRILSAILAVTMASSLSVLPASADIELVPGADTDPYYKMVELDYNVTNLFQEGTIPSSGGNVHGSGGYICAAELKAQDIWEEDWTAGMTENTLTANGVKFKMKVQAGGSARTALTTLMEDLDSGSNWMTIDMDNMKYTSVDFLGYFAMSSANLGTTSFKLNYTDGTSEYIELGEVANIGKNPTVDTNSKKEPYSVFGKLDTTVRMGNNAQNLATKKNGYFSHYRLPADNARVLDNIQMLRWEYDLVKESDGTYTEKKIYEPTKVAKAVNIHAITGVTTVGEENAKREAEKDKLPVYRPVDLSGKYNVNHLFSNELYGSGNAHGSNGYICIDEFKALKGWTKAWTDGMTENTFTLNGVDFKFKVADVNDAEHKNDNVAIAALPGAMDDGSTWMTIDMDNMKYTSVDFLGYFALATAKYGTTTVRLNYETGDPEYWESGEIAGLSKDPKSDSKYKVHGVLSVKYGYGSVLNDPNHANYVKEANGYMSHYRIPADSTRVLDSISILDATYDLDAQGNVVFVEGGNADTLKKTSKATNIHAITGVTTVAEENIRLEALKKVLTVSGELYRYDIDTVQFKAEFSNPIIEEDIEKSITVTVDGKSAAEGISYKLEKDGKTVTVDIPVSMQGGEVIKAKVAAGVRLRDYPENSLEKSIEAEWTANQYITAEYEGTEVIIKNNAKVSREYLAIAGKYDNDNKLMYAVKEGTLNGNGKDTMTLDAGMAKDAKAYAVVVDKSTYKPLAVTGAVKATTAETDKAADYTKAALDLAASTVKIHGITETAAKDKMVAVTIYDLTGAKVLYAEVVKTNADGYFSINAPINIDDIDKSGNLKISLGGDDFSGIVEIDDVYYPLKKDQIGIVNKLKKAADDTELKGLLKEAVQLLSINIAPYIELINDTDGDGVDNFAEFAARIEGIKAKLPEIADSDSEEVKNTKIVETQNILQVQAILECIEKGNSTLIANNGMLSYNDVMKYSSIDTDGVTLYNLYQNEISETGKKAVVSSLLNKDYQSADALYDDLEKAIMLNILKNPAKSGTGHVQLALTEKNAKAVGMDITKYSALTDTSSADSDIANMTISELNDVVDYISKIKEESNPSTKPSAGASGGSSGRPSGGSSGGSGGVIATTPITPEINAKPSESFSDVNAAHWAYEAIEALSKKGIINGKGNGSFLPDNSITRAEFVKILCIAKGIAPFAGESVFEDVAADSWYAPYVMAAFNEGLIKGVDGIHFAPDANISRQDICTVIYRMDNTDFTGEPQFDDSEEISAYAKSAVAYGFSKGFISGFPDNTFRPKANCTRAQAAVIIYKYLNID